MNSIWNFLQTVFRGLQPWIVVAPWEQALRVRLGKRVAHLKPGPHLRIPGVDRLYIQSVRRRIIPLDRQIITTLDGKSVTISGAIQYSIRDLLQLYLSLHDAHGTLSSLARSSISAMLCRLKMDEIRVEDGLSAKIMDALRAQFEECGAELHDVHIIDFVAVRTYRIVGDYTNLGSYTPLETISSNNAPPPPQW